MATDMAMAIVISKMVQNNFSLTDLHTHILPSVDDGARNVKMSLDMLRLEKKMGVDRVMLTPHFYPLHQKLNSFLKGRERAYNKLMAFWDEKTMPQLRLGAEVRYTPDLVQMDLHQLTLGESNYLLLELPDYGHTPFLEKVIEHMLSQGITPILAHVEHCTLFHDMPSQLFELIKMGALAQVDAMTLARKYRSKFAKISLKYGLAQIVASDIHNMTNRAVTIGDILDKDYVDILAQTEKVARAVWDQTPIPSFTVQPIKRTLFGYR